MRNFPVDLSLLPSRDKAVIPKLGEAAKLVAQIYAQQVNNQQSGANFYPHNLSKIVLEKKALKDSQVLSPFTIVKENGTGVLTSVPYHKEYQKDLQKINKILTEAAEISPNKNFASYLRTCGQSLLTGHYQEMDIVWLKLKDSPIDFRIGPFERYLDRLFFRKRAYQAHIGLKNKTETERAERIKNTLYTKVKSDLGKIHQVIPPERVQIVVEDNLVFAGLLAELLFSEEHFPCDLETAQKYGSRILIYLSSLKFKFESLIYPIFQVIFEKNFQKKYSKYLLFQGNFYYLLLSSLARQLHRYKDSRERLKELFPIFDQATASNAGIKHCKHLIMEGVMGQRELEATIIAHLCWAFAEWIYARNNKTRIDYLKGDALTLGFYLKEGALVEKNGIFWPDFSRIFFTIENLANIFIDILAWKSYNEALNFLENYLTLKYFRKFDTKLNSLSFP